MSSFATRLLVWAERNGRHNLPWQNLGQLPASQRAYRIWVAEIMLQQTRVDTVIPYYQRFIQRFPELETLARARLDTVLGLWSGLGYYARARNLHKAARQLREAGRSLPLDAGELHKLPGIGLSTANAIDSQCNDRPLPILDGNVRRVLARHAGIREWPGHAATEKKLWQIATGHLPASQGAAYTQAIMDLGASLCSRQRPECENCPLSGDCLTRINGWQAEIPARKPGRQRAEKKQDFLLLTNRRQQVFLTRRPPTGIWGGLWCLPETGHPGIKSGLPEARALPPVRHDFTHFRLWIQVYRLRMDELPDTVAELPGRWFESRQWVKLGLPAPIRTLLEDQVK